MTQTLRRSKSKYARTRRQNKKQRRIRGGGFLNDVGNTIVGAFKPSTDEEKCKELKEAAQKACSKTAEGDIEMMEIVPYELSSGSSDELSSGSSDELSSAAAPLGLPPAPLGLPPAPLGLSSGSDTGLSSAAPLELSSGSDTGLSSGSDTGLSSGAPLEFPSGSDTTGLPSAAPLELSSGSNKGLPPAPIVKDQRKLAMFGGAKKSRRKNKKRSQSRRKKHKSRKHKK
jgi:hypothetical protein